jgi:hypothetical protein
MQPGSGYSIVSGQAGTSLTIDDPQLAGDPEQFRVTIMPTGAGYGVQVRKGFVRSPIYRKNAAWVLGLSQFEIQKFYGFPDGSKTTGPFATANESPLVDLGGYVQIQPASVEGGSDNWGVYVIGCPPDDDVGTFVPYLAIMADGSDADTKSEPFQAGQTIKWFILYQQILQDVDTPTGTVTLQLFQLEGQAMYNYNCQKWKVADVIWDGSTFVVTQTHLGPLCLSSPLSFEGWQYVDPASPPGWFPDPYYGAELTAWNGSWSGYTKDPSGATVEV